MSLTAHWINGEWSRLSAILQTSHLQGSHTAANIQATVEAMLTDWDMKGKVLVVLRDNAKKRDEGHDRCKNQFTWLLGTHAAAVGQAHSREPKGD